MSSAAPPPQLLVIGLCGEPIVVNLLEQDTVKDVKCRAFAAASSTILDDKSRQSLVRGVTVEQLCLVHGMPEDAVKLDDASAIHHCLRHDLSDLTDAAMRQFSRRQLRLACAANDMDGFVEVERGGSHDSPVLCAGGNTGTSHTEADRTMRKKCGVFIGRWRPNSQLNPALRTRVAIKVMERGKCTNSDIQHLVSMDFPYVNHFLGTFDTSQQLGITAGSKLVIMVSSFCPGGDHWSMLHSPVYGSRACAIRLQQHADGRFCFVNPDHSTEVVHHALGAACQGALEAYSYMCVYYDPAPSPLPPAAPLPPPRVPVGVICRVEKIDEQFFRLWACDPVCTYPLASPPPITAAQFDKPFRLTGQQNASCSLNATCSLLYADKEPAGNIKTFFRCMPRPNVAFLRAFAVQLLRALGYCHSRKLTAHNDLRTVNIFHKEQLSAHHFLCATPPYAAADDAHAMLRAMKVEVGDFGRANSLNYAACNHADFRYAAMALLSSLNFFQFGNTIAAFENDLGESRINHLPDSGTIDAQCAHFTQEDAKLQFRQLVEELYKGPTHPQKAWNFAEHLLKTHSFFLPLRSEAPRHEERHDVPIDSVESFSPGDATPRSASAAAGGVGDEQVSISVFFQGIHPSPHSRFQHLISNLKLNRESGAPASESNLQLDEIFSEIRSSPPAVLSQKIQLGAFEELIRTLYAHRSDLSVTHKVLLVVLQIAECCPRQRHILMHMTHVERETGDSFLQFLVKFICSQSPLESDKQGSSSRAEDITASAVLCVRSIVSCSIPYHSLSDFPSSGCYGSPKMGSMLSAKVLQSILTAVHEDAASESFASLQDESNHVDPAASSVFLTQRFQSSNWRELVQRHDFDHELRAFAALLQPAAAERFSLVMNRARRSRAIGGRELLQAFFVDSPDTDIFFAGNRRVILTIVREDETVQEFRRLFEE